MKPNSINALYYKLITNNVDRISDGSTLYVGTIKQLRLIVHWTYLSPCYPNKVTIYSEICRNWTCVGRQLGVAMASVSFTWWRLEVYLKYVTALRVFFRDQVIQAVLWYEILDTVRLHNIVVTGRWGEGVVTPWKSVEVIQNVGTINN